VNAVGLRRRGVPEASIRALAKAVRSLWGRAATQAEALRLLEGDEDPYVRRLVAAMRATNGR
jgi:acyl-[acyl carrier protein]--UDP-N-acetylglucosamine O-acyltransferase